MPSASPILVVAGVGNGSGKASSYLIIYLIINSAIQELEPQQRKYDYLNMRYAKTHEISGDYSLRKDTESHSSQGMRII